MGKDKVNAYSQILIEVYAAARRVGISHGDIGEMLGVTRATVSQAVVRNVSRENFLRIVDAVYVLLNGRKKTVEALIKIVDEIRRKV